MGFQISHEEYETAEEVKQNSIRYEISEVMRQVRFLEDRYEQKQFSINRRWRDLKWAMGVQLTIGIGIILLIIFFQVFSNPMFSWITILVLEGMDVYVFFGLLRIILAWCTHKEVLMAPIRLIKNKMYKDADEILEPEGYIYTLTREQKDCTILRQQLQKDKLCLQHYVEQDNPSEEEGRNMLAEILPRLKEEDKHAAYLYSERI